MSQYNKYNAACPAETELIAYKNGTLPEEDKQLLTEHLLLCDFCALALNLLPSEELEYVPIQDVPDSDTRMIPAVLQKAVENYKKQLLAEPKWEPKPLKDFLDKKEELKVGQIWRTKLEDIIFPSSEDEEKPSVYQLGSVPHLVVITNPFFENIWTEDNRKWYQIIKVVPVSDTVEYASNDDIVFNEEESPLGYPLMLQIWNEQQMIMDNLDACLAKVEITPESFKSTEEGETANLINFLTNIGKQQISDSDFSFFGIIKKGIYSDSKMRFRAREFENTAYLRDPVLELRESLILPHKPEVPKPSISDRWRQFVVDLFTPIVTDQETQFEAGESQSENLEDKKLFFNGKLSCEVKNIEESGTEKEVIFHSDDPNLAGKFVLLGTEDEPVIIMLLSDNDESRKGYTSILGLKNREVPKISEEKLYDANELSELFDNGEINEKIVHDSIFCVNFYGLKAWRKVAETKEINEGLKSAILGHERLQNG